MLLVNTVDFLPFFLTPVNEKFLISDDEEEVGIEKATIVSCFFNIFFLPFLLLLMTIVAFVAYLIATKGSDRLFGAAFFLLGVSLTPLFESSLVFRQRFSLEAVFAVLTAVVLFFVPNFREFSLIFYDGVFTAIALSPFYFIYKHRPATYVVKVNKQTVSGICLFRIGG